MPEDWLADSAPATATILVADNDELTRDVLKRVLERAGHRVLDAHSGPEALHIAQGHSGPIPLLVTEITMPVMDGLTLASRLRAERPETDVLFVTAFVPEELLPRIVPGTQLLRKPFLPREFVGKVQELLAGRVAHLA